MPRFPRSLLLALLAVLALGLVACGDDDDNGGGGDSGGASTENELERTSNPEGKRGGTLTLLSAADVDYIDPGATYYSYAFAFMDAMHRPLYSFKPDDATKPVPDLAEGDPEISEDGKTVTVKIKQGVRFSPPVDREVTSKDVKYAIERGFLSSVQNGYAGAYFADIVGAPEEPGKHEPIEGIETPDDQTVVFKLDKATGAVLAGALALPLSAPVPEDYAKEFDAETTSTYGKHQVATGPYMPKGTETGTNSEGYKPGKRIELVRNPNWDGENDYRPAYLDRIVAQAGNEDTASASRRVLQGQSMATGDITPPPAELKRIYQQSKEQLSMVPSGGWRNVAVNTKLEPFDDINVRKAVLAGADREAMRLTRGGEFLGPIAQHYIPPGVPGFDESGGETPDWLPDFMKNTRGDKALMAEYFKKAGYSSGKYEGNETILMVADQASPQKELAAVVQQQFEEMGFKVKLQQVPRSTMFTKFCNRPSADVHVCPSVGWLKDFADAQPMLDPTFNGENIVPANNSNWPQLDVEELNKKMNDAKTLVDSDERAEAWADINRNIVEQAPGIPYIWDNQASAFAKNVQFVQSKFSTLADLSHTSIK
jgi:peptide/nickel transport system substrate-binding protein